MELFTTNNKLASVFVRVGLAATLLYSVVTKLTNTEMVSGMFNALLGFGGAGFTIFMAIVIAVLAVSLLANFQPQLVGVALSIFFAVAIISGLIAGGFAFGVGPAIWKDFGLLGASLSIAFMEQ